MESRSRGEESQGERGCEPRFPVPPPRTAGMQGELQGWGASLDNGRELRMWQGAWIVKGRVAQESGGLAPMGWWPRKGLLGLSCHRI